MDGNNCSVFSASFSVSEKTGLSPEDTALIKGTDRGSFVGSPDEFAQNELSPVGATISGIDGSDGLAPQDPFWENLDALSSAERPFEPIFSDLINIILDQTNAKNYRTSPHF